jgi:uncharacterized protein (DUF433 family)
MVEMSGRYIVTAPDICHGKPTFRGTRIMVWQVLELVAQERPWEQIIELCHNSITKEAIAEAILLAGRAFVEHAHEYLGDPVPA